jgi:hypothetical protein
MLTHITLTKFTLQNGWINMLAKFERLDGTNIGINPENVEAVSQPNEQDAHQGAKSAIHMVSGKVFSMKTPFNEAIELINGKG